MGRICNLVNLLSGADSFDLTQDTIRETGGVLHANEKSHGHSDVFELDLLRLDPASDPIVDIDRHVKALLVSVHSPEHIVLDSLCLEVAIDVAVPRADVFWVQGAH